MKRFKRFLLFISFSSLFVFGVVLVGCGLDNDEKNEGTNPITSTWYADMDNDSYGDPKNSIQAESQPAGYVADNRDCNDNDDSIHPGVSEVCGDGIDQECNGDDLACTFYYKDCDGDLYSDGHMLTTQASGYFESTDLISTSGDCDDNDASVYPGLTESCNDNIVQDCNNSYCGLGGACIENKISDTGQTISFTDTFGEDSDYSINPQSYTKLDSNGNDLPDTATDWSMVRDNIAGLIWEVKTDANKGDMYNWRNAREIYIAELNSKQLGGYSDWRLPTIKELYLIVDKGEYNPAINSNYFKKTKSSKYWSSNLYQGNSIVMSSATSVAWGYMAWSVDFSNGDIKCYDWPYETFYVRAVRGESISDVFSINGDGTITDLSTALMWQQEISEVKTWEEALKYCDNLNFAGYTDWRLPNINELHSIVNYAKWDPIGENKIFPNILSLPGIWSSTTQAESILNAWLVVLSDDSLQYDLKSGLYSVRAVRSLK